MIKAKIYTDPMTRKDLEGEALVLKFPGLREYDTKFPDHRRCMVSFDGDDDVVSRLIHKDDFYIAKEN